MLKNIMSALDSTLQYTNTLLVAIAIMLAVLLLWAFFSIYSVDFERKEGMGNLPGSSLAFQSLQTAANQGYGDNLYHPGGSVRGEGMMPYEPPVLHAPTDHSVVGGYLSSSAASGNVNFNELSAEEVAAAKQLRQRRMNEENNAVSSRPIQFDSRLEGMHGLVPAVRAGYTGMPTENFSPQKLNPY